MQYACMNVSCHAWIHNFFPRGGRGGGSAEGYLSLPAIRGIFSAILLCKFEKFKFSKEERGEGPDHRPPPPTSRSMHDCFNGHGILCMAIY